MRMRLLCNAPFAVFARGCIPFLTVVAEPHADACGRVTNEIVDGKCRCLRFWKALPGTCHCQLLARWRCVQIVSLATPPLLRVLMSPTGCDFLLHSSPSHMQVSASFNGSRRILSTERPRRTRTEHWTVSLLRSEVSRIHEWRRRYIAARALGPSIASEHTCLHPARSPCFEDLLRPCSQETCSCTSPALLLLMLP